MKATWPVFSSSCTICQPYYNSCQQGKTYHCHLLFLADSQILPERVAEKSTKTELQPQMYHYDFLLTPCSYQGKDTVQSALLVFLPAQFLKKKAWYFLQDQMKSHVRSLDSDRVSKPSLLHLLRWLHIFLILHFKCFVKAALTVW